MNEVGVVISRYHENIQWIEELKTSLDVYIYHRSGPVEQWDKGKYFYKTKTEDINVNTNIVKNNGVNLEIIDIPDDLGYEASTYTRHFWTKYHSLNDITICLQGNPKNYIKNIVKLLNDPYKLVRTKFSASNPKPKLEDPLILTITEEPIDFSYISDCFGYLTPSADYGWLPHINDFTKSPWWFFLKNMPGWVENKNDLKELGSFTFGAGNQFMVNKKSVLRHEPDYYKRIHEFTKTYMDTASDNDRPVWQQKNQGPNIMEGTWQFVF